MAIRCMDRGARWATVRSLAKSGTRLSDEYFHLTPSPLGPGGTQGRGQRRRKGRPPDVRPDAEGPEPFSRGCLLRRTVGLGGQSDPDVKVRRFRKPAFGVSFLLPGLCGMGYLRGWGRSTTLRPRHGNYKIAARARPATSCKREGKGRGRRAAGGCFPSLTNVCLFCSWAYSSSHGKEDARWLWVGLWWPRSLPSAQGTRWSKEIWSTHSHYKPPPEASQFL